MKPVPPSARGERYQQVAALHASNLESGFLPSLGEEFLALMYRAIDETGDAVLLTVASEGRVVGFVSGGCGMGSILRRMLRHPVRLARALLPTLVRPRRVRRVLEVLSYGQSTGDGTVHRLPRAELLSIAVDPASRGTGIAEDLYRRLVDHFSAAGINAFRITVGEALIPAQRFYERMGARQAGVVEVHSGERSLLYIHEVGGKAYPVSRTN